MHKTQIKDIRSTAHLPILLFWQYVVIAISIGIIATRAIELAFFLALFLMLFMAHTLYNDKNNTNDNENGENGDNGDNKESINNIDNRKNKENIKDTNNFPLSHGIWKQSYSFILRVSILSIFILTAFFYATWRNPLLNSYDVETWDDFNNPMQYMYIEAKIHSVQGLPGGRLRLLLKEVNPLTGYNITSAPYTKGNDDNKANNSRDSTGDNSNKNKALTNTNPFSKQINPPHLPGMLNFTWDKSPPFSKRPMSGQSVIVRTRIRPIYGGIIEYWKDRNIWYNAWLYGDKDIFWIGQAPYTTHLRETLRNNFIKNVFLPPEITSKKQANTRTENFADNLESKTSTKPNYDYNKTFLNKNDELSSSKMQARAVLPALLFGDRFYLTNKTLDLFNGANLLHSLALSGQHLALTGFLAALLVFALVYAYPKKLIHTSRRKYIIYLSIPLALAYVFLGSAPFSLLRAFIMLSMAGLLWLKAKVFTLLDSLFLALLCFCVWWPNTLFNLGVQLSFVSVFAIALFMPYIRIPQYFYAKAYRKSVLLSKRLQKKKGQSTKKFIILKLLLVQRILIKIYRVFCTLISVSLIIQICTMPFLISYFGRISYFFLLNVLWLPVLGFIVLPFAAFALIFSYFESFSQICIDIASYPPYILIEFLTWLNAQGFNPFLQSLKPSILTSLGFYTIVLYFCYYIFSASRISEASQTSQTSHGSQASQNAQAPLSTPKATLFKHLCFRLKPLSFILILGIGLLFSGAIERHFTPRNPLSFSLLDVGQGQSVLIEGKNGRILLDTGGSNSPRFNVGRDIVAQYLTENKAPKLLYIIASHDDADHINGLGHLINAFSINSFMENYLPRQKTSAARKHIDEVLQQSKLPITKLGMGDVIDLGEGFYLQVLYPPYPLQTTKQLIPQENTLAKPSLAKPRNRYSSNNGSLVMRLVKDGKGLALICGDVENSALKTLLRYQKKNMWSYNTNSPHKATQYKDAMSNWSLQAELLILPHHGSKNSFFPEFYEKVNPHSILASSGRYNRFKFPATQIQDYWNKQEKEVLTTAKEGNIHFTWNGKTLERLE